MAIKTFVVEIEVVGSVTESTFGTNMVKALQDGDIHYLSWLVHNITNIHVRPYEEPAQEWEVLVQDRDEIVIGTHGYYGTKLLAIEAARRIYEHGITFTARIKPE